MNIYDANRPGLTLTQSEMESLLLIPLGSERGYLSNEDLRDLIDLTKQAECVGIRIYNSCNTDEIIPDTIAKSNRIMAIAVKADGYELSDRFMISNDCDKSENHLPAQLLRDRSLAKMQLDAAFTKIERNERYSSFFSREDILRLTDPTLSKSGVCFYFVRIDKSDNPLSEFSFPEKFKAISSHVAVPINVGDLLFPGSLMHFNPSNAPNNVFSDRPCYGHCPTITNVEEVNNGADAIISIGDSPASGVDSNKDPYIVKW